VGQVSALQGAYQFVLNTAMVLITLWLFAGASGRRPGWAWIWLPLAAFAAAFAAHILAFILLKSLLGQHLDPWVHRPIVALVWGAATGVVFYLYCRPLVRPAAIAALLTAVSYLVFIMTRHHI